MSAKHIRLLAQSSLGENMVHLYHRTFCAILYLFFVFLLSEQQLREKELASSQNWLKYFIRESNRPSKAG